MNTQNNASVPERGTVRLERLLPGPIERVWDYLTDPEKRKKWFAGGPMELHPGGALALEVNHAQITDEPTPERYKNHMGKVIPGTVTQCEPPRLLAFRWPMGDDDTSETIFELTPAGDKVKLVLTHRRLADLEYMQDVSSGWHLHLGVLENVLNGRAVGPFWGRLAELRELYIAQLKAEDAPPPAA